MRQEQTETVAAYLASALADLGVTHVFELVGGMITVLLDAMHQEPRLTVTSMHHEQGAGFAAEGFARVADRPAVAMATSGPGATNLLTAVGSCYFDSIPVVFLTGQVNREEMRRDGRGRQGGFQETDIVAMARPVTKWSTTAMSAEEFPDLLARAFDIATSGRPGPVLIDIPMDVQRTRIASPPRTTSGGPADRTAEPTPDAAARAQFLERLAVGLRRARRPLVIAGGGVRSAGQVDAFTSLVETTRLPVVTSLLGLDALPSTSPVRVGLLGSYGNRWANWAVGAADLVLVLGSRLDVRQTGSDIEGFRTGREVFHVDVDDAELNYHVPGCDVLRDALEDFLPQAAAALDGAYDTQEWLGELEARRAEWPDTAENVPAQGLNPNDVVRRLGLAWPETATWVTDVGQHQMWAAQSVQLAPGQRFLTSGGMGSMGFGLPAAIGAGLAGGPVCLIAGDGGFQCNIQELQTLVRTGAPVRLVVLDNKCHGMVRQFQQSYFDGRYHSTKWGYSAPDFCAVAEAYGIRAWHARDQAGLDVALREIALAGQGPTMLHLEIDEDLNAYPKMAFGQAFGSMEPAVSPTEMEGT